MKKRISLKMEFQQSNKSFTLIGINARCVAHRRKSYFIAILFILIHFRLRMPLKMNDLLKRIICNVIFPINFIVVFDIFRYFLLAKQNWIATAKGLIIQNKCLYASLIVCVERFRCFISFAFEMPMSVYFFLQ